MTYCVAIKLNAGIVFLSDSRTNAGVDQISTFRKMTVVEKPGERLLVLMSAGNLAITQAVKQRLLEHESEDGLSLWNVPTMFEAVHLVGDAVRKVHARDAETLQDFGIEFNCSFLFGGQIAGEPCRVFMVYAAGNYIETTAENPYFQIGESKYGKPIIDRVVTPTTPLDEAAKCALISMDSTLRSNLSVGMPLDLLCYETGALRITRFALIDESNQYFQMIRSTWGKRLKQVFTEISDPTWENAQTSIPFPLLGSGHHAPNMAAPVSPRGLQTVAGTPPASKSNEP